MKTVDFSGFENEYIKIIGISDKKIQEQKNEKRKNKAIYYDALCKRCQNIFHVSKPNIKYVHSCGCHSELRRC